MEFVNLFGMIVKMGFLVAWTYGLLRVLDLKGWWRKGLGLLIAFGVIQLLFSLKFGSFQIFSPFDQGLVYQASTMAMIALGLNLIYGFNGQFSLAQWGFYGVGAYVAADITWRWLNGDARGLIVVAVGVSLAGLLYFAVARLLRLKRACPSSRPSRSTSSRRSPPGPPRSSRDGCSGRSSRACSARPRLPVPGTVPPPATSSSRSRWCWPAPSRPR